MPTPEYIELEEQVRFYPLEKVSVFVSVTIDFLYHLIYMRETVKLFIPFDM